jgi:carboxyl-terminal processing protease
VLVCAVLALASSARGGQAPADWRAAGMASFDEVWQTVADTFYDASFTGIDWPGARGELRPEAEAAGSPQEIRAVIRRLLAKLGRSHFSLLSEADPVRPREAPPIAGGEIVQLGNLPPLVVRTDIRELRTAAGRRIGFLGFNVWLPTVDAPVTAAIDRFRQADGLVIDLRDNPGGLAAMMSGVAGHLFADPVLLGRMRMRQANLEFHANPRVTTPDGRRVQPYAGRVAILVNERTGSTSECFTGALQDLGRARVFGRHTRGEALPAQTKRLPNGDVLLYAVGDFVTASGRSLEGGGVTPDELIEGTMDTGGERDPILEAALRWFDLP